MDPDPTQALRRSDLLLRGQKRALEMIARGAPVPAILDTLTGIVEQHAEGTVVCAISLLDRDGRHLRHAGEPRLPATYKKALDRMEIGPETGTCGAAASLRRVVVTDNIEQAFEWAGIKHLALSLGLRAAWSMPILSAEGQILGTFGTYFRESRAPSHDEREVVELLAHTAAIAIERQHAAEIALETERRKEQFLAMLAHELRHPLAPIRTAAQVLGFTEGDNTALDRVRIVIERQVQSMTRLIDDLVDVSRITRGALELRIATIDVAQLTARAVETVSPLIEKRDHRLTVTVPDEPVVVRVDATRMEQVLVNLLTNAAKFTPIGGLIAIDVAAQGNDMVTIRVTDNGRGISLDLLPRVFDMFIQGSGTLDRSEGGIGIGLTIAHRLVEMHSGSISVRSDGPGCGSEFTVALPRATGAAVDDAPALSAGPVQPRKILVVEDQPDAAEMLALLLTAQSHEVRVAGDGHTALVAAAEFHPDVMLVDIGLPGMSGYDLAERVRSDRTLAQVCLIAVTGYGGLQDRMRAFNVGFDHHVVKPVDERVLTRLLAEAGRARPAAGGHRMTTPT